jgi:hypothetical protein
VDADEGSGPRFLKGNKEVTNHQSMFFPQDERPSFTPTQNRKCILIFMTVEKEGARQN